MCTVFGLKKAELQFLVKNQDKLDLSHKITDRNRDNDGIEIATSAYKVNIWYLTVAALSIKLLFKFW